MRGTPRRIMVAGWLVFLVYAWPGYMSFDSVLQLQESRSGYYIDGHPPLMAALWRIVELFVAGPAGMLLVQSACFLAGAYLVLGRVLSARAAAIAAVLVLWFPPIGGMMAVIWKDSQMAAFLLLGFGLILQPHRRTRLWGLVAFVLATGMRHNALVMTGPMIAICFAWDPSHRFVKRYAIAIAAWVAVTLAAQVISGALVDEQQHIWHTSLALCDITGTLRYTTPDIPDDELRRELDGLGLLQQHDLHAFTRREAPGFEGDYVGGLWRTTYELFDLPKTQADRDAATRAWKKIVLGHPGAYLAYRIEIYKRLLGLGGGDESGSPIYNWFVDIQDLEYSSMRAEHDAAPSHVQDALRDGIHVVGRTPVFYISVYVVLALVLLPFAFRDRRVLALLASGLTNEAVLFLVSPTTDWRYSSWLVIAVVFSIVMLVATRSRPASPEAA